MKHAVAAKDAIYFRHARKVMQPAPASTDESTASEAAVATVVANLVAYGFSPSKELTESLRAASLSSLGRWHDSVLALIKDVQGDALRYAPVFYPNFPASVASASDAELILNALVHYWGVTVGLNLQPNHTHAARDVLLTFPEAKTLDIGTEEDFQNVLFNVLVSKLSWGEAEVSTDVPYAIDNHVSIVLRAVTDERFVNRENKAHLWVAAVKQQAQGVRDAVEASFNSASDVLRAAAAYSGHSPALAGLSKVKNAHVDRQEFAWTTPLFVQDEVENKISFRSFPNAVRRFFLNVVNEDKNAQAVMARHGGLWKILGEKLHPGDKAFRYRYPNAFAAFTALRNNALTHENSVLESALTAGNIAQALDALEGRAGELVRRADHLLRLAVSSEQDTRAVLGALRANADKVSTNVLWQALQHFRRRNTAEVRAVFPKGSIAKMNLIAGHKALPVSTVSEVVSILSDAIVSNYARKEAFAHKVYIDPSAYGSRIPNALRNATDGATVIGRGSRIPFPVLDNGKEASVVRLFTHWKNQNHSRVDIDLSAITYGDDFKNAGSVWYGDLRGKGIVHSGDITDAPDGASEYIDVDLSKVNDSVRYVAVTITSYTRQSLDSIPELFAGIQARPEDAQAGEIYEPRSVVTKFAVTTAGVTTVPLIVDLKAREIIWVDTRIDGNRRAGQNVLNQTNPVKNIVMGLVDLAVPTVGEVVEANVFARGGELVSSADEADVIVSYDQNGLSIPMSEILAEWL